MQPLEENSTFHALYESKVPIVWGIDRLDLLNYLRTLHS